MKKSILLFVALCAMVAAAVAQQRIEVKKNLDSKKIDATFVRESKYMGQYNGLYCFVGEGRRHRKLLMLSDHNLVPLRVAELPESSANCDLMAGSIDGTSANMLFVDNDPHGLLMVYTARIDLDSMRPADGGRGFVTIDSVTFGRKDRCMVWAATSDNGQYNALIYIVQYPERKQYSAHAKLFDARIQTVWSHDYAMGSMDHLCVTDNGTLVTLGYEPNGEETHFVFNILNSEKMDTYDAIVKCDPIRELHLAGVQGSHVMALGLFNPLESRNDGACGGVVGMSFDMDSALLTGFTMRPFQNEDVNILYNKKTKKIQRTQEVDFISVLGTVMTDNGAVVAVGRNFIKDKIEDNGNVTPIYHRMGLHLVAIDTMGNLSWVRNIRRNDMQKRSDSHLKLALLHVDGLTHVIKSEHRKYPADYNIAKAAKEFTATSKSNLVIYSIAPDGTVVKNILEKKTRYGLVRSLLRNDGAMTLFTQDGSRSKTLEVKVEK